MANVILLANQERLIKLFTGQEILRAGKIRVTDDIDEALRVLSSHGQSLIFIQERLGEISGELLSHRIAAEMKGKKVRIILFGNPRLFTAKGRKPFHEILDTDLTDGELSANILEILTAPAKRTSRKKPSIKRKKAAGETSEKPLEPVAALSEETVDDIVEIRRRPSMETSDVSVREQSPPPESGKSSFQVRLEHALDPEKEERTGPPPKTSLLARMLAHAPRRRALTLLGLFSVCFAALLLFLLYHQPKPSGTPGDSPAARAKGETESRPFLNTPGALPSFVPREPADADYGKANPGWERYRNASTEFRIYRKKGSIRAFQIIDRSGKGINPDLFSAALRETIGSRKYLIETTERKKTYLIERGRFPNGYGIILYRREPERTLKAFVLELAEKQK